MPEAEPSGLAVCWTVFAAFMMIVQGGWWIFSGFVGVLDNELIVAGNEYLFQFDLTTWVLIHMCMGVVMLAAAGLFGMSASRSTDRWFDLQRSASAREGWGDVPVAESARAGRL